MSRNMMMVFCCTVLIDVSEHGRNVQIVLPFTALHYPVRYYTVQNDDIRDIKNNSKH